MVVQGLLIGNRVITENSTQARDFYQTSRFGSLLKSGQVDLSLLEALYLVEKKRLQVLNGRKQEVLYDSLARRGTRLEHDFLTRFAVFRDIRNRGYIIKTALKFGADFRVYARGKKPGQAHAKWVVYPVRESEKMTWQDFAAKNRVAHSTKKKLMVAVVDDESDVNYWEVRWVRP